MDYALFIESMDYEFRTIHEDCDKKISFAIARYEESVLDLNFFTESEEQKSGGLIGMIKTVLDAIKRAIQACAKTVKGVLFGTKPDKSKDNVSVQIEKNPNLLLKFVNGEVASSKELLAKAARGELSVDEVKESIRTKDGKLQQIAGTAMTMASMFGICQLGDRYMTSWQKEIEDAYSTCDDITRKATEKMSRTQGNKEKQKIMKETTQLVMQHMNSVIKEGENCIESMIRKMYMNNYIKKKLKTDVVSYDNKKGNRDLKKRHKLSEKKAEKEIKQEEEKEKWRKAGDEEIERHNSRMNELNNKKAQVKNQNYIDSDEFDGRKVSKSTSKKGFFGRFKK